MNAGPLSIDSDGRAQDRFARIRLGQIQDMGVERIRGQGLSRQIADWAK